MTDTLRGADIVTRTLERAGVRTIFTLSGNHIMPLFDAAIEPKLDLIHVRHEAAAVHMADAFGRLTGTCGVAMVTGGPGHANAVGALYTAQVADSPVLLLSGHAGLGELGRGGFQEMRQAEMAAPVTKESWTARSVTTLGPDIAEAIRIATTGRPGPVHLSLPFDLLEARVPGSPELIPPASAFAPAENALEPIVADTILATLAEAKRPLILAGPLFTTPQRRDLMTALSAATGVPVVPMESPRGVNDPNLGAFAEVLRQADLIVLLAKPLDFTLKFADAPHVAESCRFVVIDPDRALIARAEREKGQRLVRAILAEPVSAAKVLAARAKPHANAAWRREVAAATTFRPAEWATQTSATVGKLHPLDLCRAVAGVIETTPEAILVCDGGEIGQWPQGAVRANRRVINGVAGSIGASIPFALAARAVDAKAPVIAVMGDGTFGFHMAEFDTAVRHNLPFVAVVGNDAAWNAEHQIQLRSYGKDRTFGCELLPTRYDRVVEAMGGHGEHVTSAADLEPALKRAIASGKPACVNVMIERVAAPQIKR